MRLRYCLILLATIFSLQSNAYAGDRKFKTPLRKVFVVDIVAPTAKSRISATELANCQSTNRLIASVIKFGPPNNLAIEKIDGGASKQLMSGVLRLEVDQLYNRTVEGSTSSRMSINAYFLVADGSARAYNFDCTADVEHKPPYLSFWSCARFAKCAGKVGRDIAQWLTNFD